MKLRRASFTSRQVLLRALAGLSLAVLSLGLMTGCIRSRVKITSEPAGAEVIWRGQPYGATPITIPFIWYWHYDVALEKPGYKRLETSEHFRTAPWFLMPLDLFMEMIPVPIPDTRERHYVLQPMTEAERPITTPEMVLTPEMLRAIESRRGDETTTGTAGTTTGTTQTQQLQLPPPPPAQ